MRKKSFAVLLFIILIICMDSTAVASGSSYILDDCDEDPCICFIQRGDSGGFVEKIIDLLIEHGYCNASIKRKEFTDEVEQAVMQFQSDNHLPITGTMDDDTLTLLIWNELPEDLDAKMPVIRGKPETFPDMVYVPTDGGKKRHSNPECSDMYHPRKVSIRNAAKLGYDACKKCEAEKEGVTLH